MGSAVSGAWIAMYDEHSGLKQAHNMSEDERQRQAAGEPIYNDDPGYIIFVNSRTGQRFKLSWNKNSGMRQEYMDMLLKEREAQEALGMPSSPGLDVQTEPPSADVPELWFIYDQSLRRFYNVWTGDWQFKPQYACAFKFALAAHTQANKFIEQDATRQLRVLRNDASEVKHAVRNF